MHLDQETLSRLVDGELPDDEVRWAEIHLAECTACSARKGDLVATDDLVSSLLPYADDPTPHVDPAELIRRARPAAPRRLQRWAAALILTAAGAGAAYAAPGSPLPALLGRGDDQRTGTEFRQEEPEPSSSGLVLPLDQPLTVRLEGITGPGALIVTTGTGPGIAIESTRAGVSFESEAGVITVSQQQASAGDFRLNVPPEASSARIVLNGREVWRMIGGSIETTLPESPDGTYREELP
ncbi:MAG: hypothetical protein HKN73_09565 [Gemmatimonadetes bacterium]|nr:hypothetical protein [Gemmatimonadota bacterium]